MVPPSFYLEGSDRTTRFHFGRDQNPQEWCSAIRDIRNAQAAIERAKPGAGRA
jgi:hypothetical protein